MNHILIHGEQYLHYKLVVIYLAGPQVQHLDDEGTEESRERKL